MPARSRKVQSGFRRARKGPTTRPATTRNARLNRRGQRPAVHQTTARCTGSRRGGPRVLRCNRPAAPDRAARPARSASARGLTGKRAALAARSAGHGAEDRWSRATPVPVGARASEPLTWHPPSDDPFGVHCSHARQPRGPEKGGTERRTTNEGNRPSASNTAAPGFTQRALRRLVAKPIPAKPRAISA